MAHENATPRPWTFDDNSGWQPWSGAVEICRSPGWTIGWMCSGEEASANAALIVEAVNAYDTLRAENERLRQVAHDLTSALVQVRPLGGSELYKKFDDQTYFAEPAYCAAVINSLRDENRQYRKEEARRKQPPLSEAQP